MPVFIEVKNLTVDFDGLKALKNVSLNINEGEVVGILGKSGSGKTILMHVLRGTESFENISGEVIYHLVHLGHVLNGSFFHLTQFTVSLSAFSPENRRR